MIKLYIKTKHGYLLVKSRDDLIVFELSQGTVWLYDQVPAVNIQDSSFDLPLSFTGKLGDWHVKIFDEKNFSVNITDPENGDMVCAFGDELKRIDKYENGDGHQINWD